MKVWEYDFRWEFIILLKFIKDLKVVVIGIGWIGCVVVDIFVNGY